MHTLEEIASLFHVVEKASDHGSFPNIRQQAMRRLQEIEAAAASSTAEPEAAVAEPTPEPEPGNEPEGEAAPTLVDRRL